MDFLDYDQCAKVAGTVSVVLLLSWVGLEAWINKARH